MDALSAAPAGGPILTVNAGSSTLKLSVLGERDELLCQREGDAVDDGARLRAELAGILEDAPEVVAAGHRVVHGGPDFTAAALVESGVERALEELSELAPLHNPPAVAAMRALDAVRPGLPAIACFDTAFHASLPPAAATYAVPEEWRERWPIRRYGFHGLSHGYSARRAAELLGRPLSGLRLVTAHLGAGASLAAVHAGRSVDTTMGFTPLEGLAMGTRSGSVDPGLVLWLLRHGSLGAEEIETALERESGLLALSGRSADMREIVAGLAEGDERCRLAFDVYVHRLGAGIAGMTAAMGGIDALVFTGGVGENSKEVRAAAAGAAAHLGVAIDPSLGTGSTPDALISPPQAAAAVIVVHAREDLEIAAQVRAALR